MSDWMRKLETGAESFEKWAAIVLGGICALGILILVGAWASAGPYSGPDEDAIKIGGLLAGLSFLAMLCLAFMKRIFGGFLENYRSSYWQTRREAEAQLAADGRKPMGEPWAATHGGAYFMTPNQIKEAGHGFDEIRNDMPVLGHLGILDKHGKPKEEAVIHHNAPGHLLTVAPTRSGKGVSAVITNLLAYRGSVIVNDIKGENFDITARCRSAMGQDVVRFAPVSGDSAHWNPLEFIAVEGDDAWEDAGILAELLFVPTGGTEAQYFEDRARNFLTAVIMHVASTCSVENGRSLWHVRHLLTLPRADFDELLKEMAASAHASVQRAANLLADMEDKQREQIMATLDSQMAIWDSERLAAVMSGASDFSFADAKREGLSIYFQVPPDRLKQYKPLLRVFFGMAIREMSRTPEKPEPPVLFMLDEFPALGRMQTIEDAIPYLAGYGTRLWLFAQDLGQLRKAYGDGADSILANCGCWQFFGVQDAATARLVSEMTGQTTVSTMSRSAEAGWAFNDKQPQHSVSEAARLLMTTDEVANLDPNWELVFINGIRPIQCMKATYFAIPAFDGLYDEVGAGPTPEEVSRRPRRQRLAAQPPETSDVPAESTPTPHAADAASGSEGDGQTREPVTESEPVAADTPEPQQSPPAAASTEPSPQPETPGTEDTTITAESGAAANDDTMPDKNEFVALAEGTLGTNSRSTEGGTGTAAHNTAGGQTEADERASKPSDGSAGTSDSASAAESDDEPGVKPAGRKSPGPTPRRPGNHR